MSIGSTTPGASTASELAAGARAIAAGAESVRSGATGARRSHSPFRSADRDRTYRSLLVAADVLAVVGVALVAMLVAGSSGSGLAALLAVPVIVLVGRLAGTYDRGDLLVRRTTLDEVPVLFQLAAVLAVVVWLIGGALPAARSGRSELLVVGLGLFVLLIVFRGTARWCARIVTAPERCLVIGDEASCEMIQAKFARLGSVHAIVAALATPKDFLWNLASPASAADFQHLAERLEIDRVVVTTAGRDERELVELLETVASTGRKVSVLPTMFEVLGPPMELDHLEGVPLLSTRSVGLPPGAQAVKRTVDVLVSVIGLIVLGPLLALIAVAIKLDSAGPVFFRQRRIGRDAVPFEMLKFRTMVSGADAQKDALWHLNEAVGLFKIATDPRVTRFGRILRRTSLDELPQLWNVLRGEMSLVGPRPLIKEEDERVRGWQRRRLQLKPGMTGHWQVSGSARIPLDEMARIDYLYVTNWSLWLDLKILIRTLPYMLSGKGL